MALLLVLLAVFGHACALMLIDVRPYAMFQHYHAWRFIAAELPLSAWGVLAQTLIVSVITWRHRAALAGAIGGVLSRRASLMILVMAGFSLAVPTESVPRFIGETVLAGAIAVVALLNVMLAVMAIPDSVMSRAVRWVDARVTFRISPPEPRAWDRWLPIAVAVWVTLLAAVVSALVLERLPHIDDSVSYLFQAKYFATGRLYLPPPPDLESFRIDLTMVHDRKWFGYGFPGWPAVLALGVVAGAPWLVNPILAGVLVLLGHAWLRRRINRATANGAILLLAASSWLIFMSAELMSHPLTAVLAMLALVAIDRATEQTGTWVRWSLVAGAASGALFLTRAFDGILVSAALGVLVLIERGGLRAWRPLVVTALTAVIVGALIFPYNRAVTGRATYPPHRVWVDAHYGPGVDVIGFGPKVGIRAWPNLDPLPGHGPADVVLNLNKNLFMTNVDLFGWAMGSLLFVWLALGLRRWQRGDAGVLMLPVVYAIGYSAFWFSGGPDLGARYWYPAIVPLAALSARGAQMVADALQVRGRVSHGGGRLGAFILLATASAALVMLPWRATTKHYRYRGISAEARQLAAQNQFDRAIVFVRAPERERDYASVFTLNPASLGGRETIYAFDAGPSHRAAVVAHFSDRTVWVIGRDPSPTEDAPLRVIAGPLPPGSVPE